MSGFDSYRFFCKPRQGPRNALNVFYIGNFPDVGGHAAGENVITSDDAVVVVCILFPGVPVLRLLFTPGFFIVPFIEVL